MTTRKECKAKTVTAEEAISTIKNGSRVFIGSGCGEPQQLIHTMANNEGVDEQMAGRTAQYVKELVEDGSTLRVGYGHTPYALLRDFSRRPYLKTNR